MIPRRRPLRIYVLVIAVLIFVAYTVARQSVFGFGQSVAELERTGVDDGGLGGKSAHPVDEFVKGFHRLRGPGDLGIPASIRAAGEHSDGAGFDWPRTTKMFVFGDSASTMDADYRANGVDNGHHERFHHKATDMKWPDYLYAMFHDFHILQYYNFAKVGAVIDRVIVPPGLAKYGTLVTQIEDFEDLFTPLPGPSRVNWHSNDSLFIIFSGINDMGRLNREDIGRQDIPTTTRRLAESLVNSLRRLYKTGARSFLIINLPPLEHSPKYSVPGESGIKSHDLIGQSVRQFNGYLKAELDEWKEEADEAGDKEVMLYDLESFWRIVLEYPELFGITETTRYQMWIDGKRPNLGRMGYFFHDNQHFSWSTAELLARNVHGFLLRHSRSFQESNATHIALHA